MLDHDIKQFPAYARGADILQIGAAGLLLALVLPLLSPVWGASATGLLLLAVLGTNFWFWQAQNLVLPLAAVLTLIVILFVLYMSYGFFVERRGKKQIAATFGQYVPPELVDEMNFDPRSYTLEAENREMTVLFSDVRGFTSLSEGLSPGELSQLMNVYLTSMTTLIHDNRGTIDKYIGDAVMAFWGAPVENPEHARCAVRTGMAMQERMHALRKEFHEHDWPELHIGVGINTGTMSVGNMGSKFRMAYTVLGDAVNLGSRLEGLTKTYGAGIIVSEETRVQAQDYIYRELDVVRVKGKDRPIAIYEPVALSAEVSMQETEELESYARALNAYRGRDWQQAWALFTRLREGDPGKPLYRLYLERIATFRDSPPGPDWDGVFTHASK
jgi:adenylate cyclase